MLKPVEKNIQNGFRNEAVDRLNAVNPKVVSITGSYGKTSVKHIVGHVLSLNTKTVTTPGSVNTEMGVARILREDLAADTEFFVTEMGAYGIGSIARLCRFTPPKVGIITAIGPAHLERFKTLENTAKAKFELADAVLAEPDGHMILHESVMKYGDNFDFITQNRSRVSVVGPNSDNEFVLESSSQTKDGISAVINHSGQSYEVFAPLFGEHHASNMALAFATAVVVGIDPSKAVTALRTAPQIKHRLEVKRQNDGTTYIDDAFNSNPKGFAAAMELMGQLKASGASSYLITPGITELGDDHAQVHQELGAKAAGLADNLFVVNPGRVPTLISGFESSGGKTIEKFETFLEADARLRGLLKPGDVVLVENDLPDLFNDPLRI